VPALTAAAVKAKAEGVDSSKTFASAADIQLESPFTLAAPNFLPKAGSPALAANAASFYMLPGFTVTSYVGAVSSTNNWLTGWTSFTPQTNAY
jgi:hypothetical protein